MKRFGSMLATGVVVLSLSLYMTGCGGGGGASTSREGGPDATLTAANAGQVGDTVTQAVKLVAPGAAMGELKTSGISADQSAPLLGILEQVLSASGNSAAARHINGVSVYDKPCAGGNITANVNDVDFVNKLIKGDVNANSCKIGTQTLNGTMHVEYKLKNLSDLQNPTYENLKNFEKVTITTSGFTYVNTGNSDNITLTDMTMVLKDFTYNGNVLTGGSITMGGKVSGTIGGEAINIECDSLGLLFSAGPTGVTVSISGRIKAACVGGWVTLATNAPVFLPANAPCPTGGNIAVTAGGNTVIVNIAPDSRIAVFFNGDLVKAYKDCSEVKGLCTA
jgi:hypothetical protein